MIEKDPIEQLKSRPKPKYANLTCETLLEYLVKWEIIHERGWGLRLRQPASY